MLKDDLTIICPLHCRDSYIEGFLKYYQDLSCKILLVDSTPLPAIQKKIGLVEPPNSVFRYDKENLCYLYYPDKIYYKKMYEALQMVDTPFVVEIADDDKVHKKALLKAVSFLKENPEYLFADGRWYCDEDQAWFKLSGEGLIDETGRLDLFWAEQEEFYIGTNFFSEDPFERIRTYLNKQWKAPNHCVVRTDLLKEIYGFVDGERLLWPLRWFDKIWMFIAGYRGSYKCLDVKYGRKCPSSIITDSEMIHSIPMSLGVHLYWSNFPDMKDSYMRLANFLIKEGHDESFSISFVEEIIRHVP